jgi:hypothetical protein
VQKVDIVYDMPPFVGGRAVYAGEVLRIRVVHPEVDPFALLGYLRRSSTRCQIQEMVLGPSAHLRPRDLLTLPLPEPENLATPDLVVLLRQEADLARQMNLVKARQRDILDHTTEGL